MLYLYYRLRIFPITVDAIIKNCYNLIWFLNDFESTTLNNQATSLDHDLLTLGMQVNSTEGMSDSNPDDVILTSLQGAGPKRRNFAAQLHRKLTLLYSYMMWHYNSDYGMQRLLTVRYYKYL